MQCVIWKDQDGDFESSVVECPMFIDGENARASTDEATRAKRVLISPIRPCRNALAVLLVPEAYSAGQAARNGTLLTAGFHLLRHDDHLEIDGRSFWISASGRPELTSYDPARHGKDGFCFVTKARLAIGQEIVVCPGTPEKPCRVLYKRAAWEAIEQGSKPMRCANCGFEPAKAEWRPPQPQNGRRLDQLFDLIAHRSKR